MTKHIILYLLLSCAVVGIVSCSKRDDKESASIKLRKYVYVSSLDIIHSNSKCVYLLDEKNENGHKTFGTAPLDTSIFVMEVYQKICPHCIPDSIYTHLTNINLRNEERFKKAKEVFDAMSADGVLSDRTSFQTFLKMISSENKRRVLYEELVDAGADVGSFAHFSKCIGFGDYKD